jgi:colanic acid/amylovoran biosynthesis glycosyltransferase
MQGRWRRGWDARLGPVLDLSGLAKPQDAAPFRPYFSLHAQAAAADLWQPAPAAVRHAAPALSRAQVAVLVGSFPKLSETFVIDQIAALVRRGCDVGVFARERAADGLSHPAVKQLGLMERARFASDGLVYKASRAFVRGRRFGELVRRSAIARNDRGAAGYSVVLCHFGTAGLRAATLKRKGLISGDVWTIFHGSDLSSFLQRSPPDVYRRLFETGDRFLPVSEFWRSRLIKLGCPPERISVLHMGVDMRAFAFRERPPRRSDLELISVARLVEKKGIAVALKALSILRQLRPDLMWRYRIVGDGPSRSRLQNLAESLGIGQRVEFLGAQAAVAVRGLVDQSDIFILPSVTAQSGDQEGIPVSLMEAMANGAAVASTFHSGIPELVEHGVCGLLAPERDAVTLADNLLQLMENPDLRQRLASAGRAKVEAEFDQEALGAKLHAMISEAAAGNP